MQRALPNRGLQLYNQIWNASSNFISHGYSFCSPAYVRANAYYSVLPTPARRLFEIPVSFAKTIQENIFPTILFTEGYHVFRQNFGFIPQKFIPFALAGGLVALQLSSPVFNLFIGGLVITMTSIDKRLQNNLLLYGIAICTFAKVYINPWFDEEHEAINGVWHNIGNTTIADNEYFTSFFASVWNFASSLFVLLLNEAMNKALLSYLKGIIVHQRQIEFLDKWPMVFYANKKSSGTEADNEKANLNPVQLFNDDIKNQNLLLPLWISRINTIVDFALVCSALFTESPEIVLPLYFCSKAVPRFLLLSMGYSLAYNTLLSYFEAPAQRLHRELSQLKDTIIRQITNIDYYSRSIIFQKGITFEIQKLLVFLKLEREKEKKHDLLDSVKELITEFIKNFEWLFPLLTSVYDVRNGTMRPEEISPYISFFGRINNFLIWVKANFEQLDEIAQSIHRIARCGECCEEGEAKLSRIKEKRVNSDEISFSGSYYADDEFKILLGQGKIVFKPGSRVHFNVPSGGGKSSLYEVFCGMRDFKGKCTLPIEESIFSPSDVYIPGPNEPLFQMICYPEKYNPLMDKLELVQGWFKSLNLPDHIFKNLSEFPDNNEITYLSSMARLASDGERKRLAFCNILLKLMTQDIKFICLDEFLKGVDAPTQEIMTKLLIDVIEKSNPKCVLLFSNHENNHGLNTHTLTINGDTKEFELVSS